MERGNSYIVSFVHLAIYRRRIGRMISKSLFHGNVKINAAFNCSSVSFQRGFISYHKFYLFVVRGDEITYVVLHFFLR